VVYLHVNVLYVENVSFEGFEEQETKGSEQQRDCEEGKCAWSFPFRPI
jgi:hypothetical protein